MLDDRVCQLEPWIDEAAAASHRISFASGGGTCNVYAVLLFKPGRQPSFGVYIGQSANPPATRLNRHLRGPGPSSDVRKWGLHLLPKLYEHFNPVSKAESLRLEAILAQEMRDIGLWVEGGH